MYTKPATWRGLEVPEILRSGDHGKIARWRRDQALQRTVERRPDLLAALDPAGLDKLIGPRAAWAYVGKRAADFR